MNYRAVYLDKNGCAYSSPVELHGETWKMLTNEGWQPISATFDDDVGGRLTFSHYREEPDTRLHIEPKQPGQSSLAQLQAAAAKQVVQARADRERRRQDVMNYSAQREATKVAEARAHATALAQRWNPKRPEPIPPTQLTEEQVQKLVPMAEEHRRHRPKKEE